MQHPDRSAVRPFLLALLAAGSLAAGMLPGHAADTGSDAPPQPAAISVDADMAAARRFIADKQWAQATGTLEQVVARQPGNADAHNLLGFSYRWLDRMDESFASYAKALAIDPDHRGAHEYIAIAYLKTGQPAKAEAHLARLQQLCSSCDETRGLAVKVADYKAGKQ